jgi:tRNA(fMet)-specific endonuclease VapC
MRLAIDTNAYIDLVRGDAMVRLSIEQADTVSLPFIALAEIRAGLTRHSARSDNERTLQAFLTKPNVSVLYADETTTLHYAAIYRQLKFSGKPIPQNDLWIAALVVQHALTLCTRDDHFAALPQIPRIS